jgi:HprK-related kinase B
MNIETCLETARTGARSSIFLDFDGFVVQFSTNSDALLLELKDYYQHFLTSETALVDQLVLGLQTDDNLVPDGDWQIKQPDPGKSKIKEHLLFIGEDKVVRKVLTGVHLFFVGYERVCAGPLEANPNQVVNFINNMHLDCLLADSGQLFHASGVCSGSVGLGMAGQSGKGKSTLALRLLQQGFDLVSNDRLVVNEQDGSLNMFGVAKYPRVNPGTVIHQPELLPIVADENLARYRAMSADELWELEEKYDAFVEPAFGVRFKLCASMKMFIILNWDRHSDEPTSLSKVNPANHPDLVETVMKSPGVMLPRSAARIGDAVVSPYIDLLNDCELYVLSGGVDFDAAATAIKQLLLTHVC